MTSIFQLYEELGDIDHQLQPLIAKRNELVTKIAHEEEIHAMRARAKIFSDIIAQVSSIKDPIMSLGYANTRLAPWRHMLPRVYFENTIQTLPEGYPSNWTRASASEFFSSLSKALESDLNDLK
jgi:hypothetical protein